MQERQAFGEPATASAYPRLSDFGRASLRVRNVERVAGRHQYWARLFFSEEKNQKTFISPPLPRSRPWPGPIRSAKQKSLLLLFFKKEGLCFSERPA
jgi:hypothetical protein